MTLEEKISAKLDTLDEYVGYLRSYQKRTLAELKDDYTLRGATERYMQLAAECVIDVSEMLITALKLGKPDEYREAILILGEASILPADFAEKLSRIAGFRNILVHEYTKIDFKHVFRYLQDDLEDFQVFARHIAGYLAKTKI